MSKDRTSSQVTQEDIAALLERLQQVREDIARLRERIDPLEAEMTAVQKEFSTALYLTFQKIQQQKADIYRLRQQIEPKNSSDISPVYTEDMHVEGMSDKQEVKRRGLDEETKSDLSEHVVLVLDEEQEDLQSHINSLCSDPAMRLADVLEQVPWGVIWTRRNAAEVLDDQYRRLVIWKKALTERFEGLKRFFLQLQRDRRYTLWLEYQKGPIVWRNFLENAQQQQQAESAELEEVLLQLRVSQSGLEDNSE